MGTNNLHLNSNEDIVEGLQMLIDAIKIRQPQAKIYLLGIYPRHDMEARVVVLNTKIKKKAAAAKIQYVDIGSTLLLKTKKINENLFSDGLHPNAEGYELLGKVLLNILEQK